MQNTTTTYTHKSLIAAALLSLCSLSFGVQAQSADVKSSDQIKADYKAANEQCKVLSGKEKDACQERAKADRTNAESDAKVGLANAKANKDVAKDRRSADYDAAIAQCKTMSGDAQKKCKTEAETKYDK